MMKNLAKTLALLFLTIGILTSNTLAMPFVELPHGSNIVKASADCNVIGEKVAEEQGGRLSRVSTSLQNAQPVCVVVVIIPAKEGERPRRVEVAVPLR